MTGTLLQSTFSLPKMDCPSEENIVSLALRGKEGIQTLAFDSPARELKVLHTSPAGEVLAALLSLNLGATLKATEPASAAKDLKRSHFSVPKMDCSSEENLVRTALVSEKGVRALTFDLPKREVTVLHTGEPDRLLERLGTLDLGASFVYSDMAAEEPNTAVTDDRAEARTLKLLLAINGAMFVIEMALGRLAQSTGLIADSLDMFADAAVYGLALFAVGRAASLKVKAAHLAGWLQVLLALGAMAEVVRRAAVGGEPASALMMGVGLLALIANVACLVLLAPKKDGGAHMKASYIFSTNDVLANMGVIVAGLLVAWTGSQVPDLVIGTVIALVVLGGARRILKL